MSQPNTKATESVSNMAPETELKTQPKGAPETVSKAPEKPTLPPKTIPDVTPDLAAGVTPDLTPDLTVVPPKTSVAITTPEKTLPPKGGKALGRGLDSLLGPTSKMPSLDKKEGLTMLPLSALTAGSYQPRTNFNTAEMQELTDSIRENGVLQPILVRPTGKTDKFDNPSYEIIAGERRWRASKEADRKTIPVVIKHLTDKQALESGLIENIQRHDLNPLEEAIGYERLVSEFNYTQENLSKSLGKSRSHIANTLRLLTLPESIQQFVRDALISAGHARTLINFPKARELAQLIVDNSYSVRQTERLVTAYNKEPFDLQNPPSFDGPQPIKAPKKRAPSPQRRVVSEGGEDIAALEYELSKALSLKSTITLKPDQSGHIQINFKTPGELDKLMSLIFGAL